MEIYGRVIEIVFRNEKIGYTVIKFSQNHKFHTAVGYMPDITKGCDYTFEGVWEKDPMYGDEFKVKTYIEDIPKTKEELAVFLSNIIPDITPMMASHLLSIFGLDVFRILEFQPEELVDVGFGNSTAQKIQNKWIEYKGIKEIRLFLQEH